MPWPLEFVIHNHVSCVLLPGIQSQQADNQEMEEEPENQQERDQQVLLQQQQMQPELQREFSLEYPGLRLISQELLKKYILYAKTHVHPVINDVDNEKIARM